MLQSYKDEGREEVELKKEILAFVILFACVYTAHADTIYKKNGEKIEGTITGAVIEGQIGIKTSNDMFFVEQADISKIVMSKKEPEIKPDWNVIIAITGFCFLSFLLVMAGRSI